tara:strand:+ start:767 stop:1465 length:699 start_codon:yes stop_codon:yes gene_type:complete
MIPRNQYWMWEKALTPEQCQDIKDAGDPILGNTKNKNATVYIGEGIKGLDTNIRICDVAWMNHSWMYELLHPFVNMANESAGWNYQWDFSESCQYTVYNKGGFYGWHTDQGNSCNQGAYRYIYNDFIVGDVGTTIAPCITDNPTDNPNLDGKIRKISMTVNLDEPDDYEGGDLEFDYGILHRKNATRFKTMTEIRPQGSLVVFPAYTYHQVQKVTKGKRHSLVMWSCGEPYK